MIQRKLTNVNFSAPRLREPLPKDARQVPVETISRQGGMIQKYCLAALVQALFLLAFTMPLASQHSAAFGIGPSFPGGSFTDDIDVRPALGYSLYYTIPLEKTRQWSISISADLIRSKVASLGDGAGNNIEFDDLFFSFTPITAGIRYDLIRPARSPFVLPFIDVSAGIAVANLEIEDRDMQSVDSFDLGVEFAVAASVGLRFPLTRTIAIDVAGTLQSIPAENLYYLNGRARFVYVLYY